MIPEITRAAVTQVIQNPDITEILQSKEQQEEKALLDIIRNIKKIHDLLNERLPR